MTCPHIGFLFALSYISIPAILKTPGIPEVTLVTLWRYVYFRGFHISPFLAVFSGICSITSSYATVNKNTANRLILAGLFMIGVVPYTLITVSPTNRILMAREKLLIERSYAETNESVTATSLEGETMEDSRRLVNKWARLNYIRAALPAVGAVLAWTCW